MILEKYSFGLGDRFGHQGKAQLQAMVDAEKQGINIMPDWKEDLGLFLEKFGNRIVEEAQSQDKLENGISV